MSEHTARAILSIASEPGDEKLGALIGEHGASRALEIIHSGQVSGAIVKRVREVIDSKALEGAMTQLANCGGRFIIPSDDEWPELLDDLDTSAPVGLWLNGTANLNAVTQKSLAVVGARASTSYGERMASEVGALAGQAGVCVVSGAAYGIDAAAHRGALATDGCTIAVLACGVDVAYPAAHAGLLSRISESGLIISEAPPQGQPHKRRFLVRNRLIATLAQSTVVIEAALRSGSLSTANWANALGRDVWGIPGPVTSATSAGVHAGIRDGVMTIVTELCDITARFNTEAMMNNDLQDPLQTAVLQIIGTTQATTETLISKVTQASDGNVDPHDIHSALAILELRGLIERTSTGWRCG